MQSVQLFWMNGPLAGQPVPIEPGSPVVFGRDETANVPISWDGHISRRHFQVAQEGEEWVVTDLRSSNGTMLNQQRVERAVVADGDVISAGASHLRVRDGAKVTPYEFVLEVLRSGPAPLFAVMDAARDPQILPLLRNSGQPMQSLFDGAKGEELAEVAPYLVQFAGPDPLLESLVYGGWGKAWGIYLNSGQGFADVRRQLKRSLMMKLEKDGSSVFFRFYDPRICGEWLPTCTQQEASEFFGGIQAISQEGEKPGVVLRFQPSPQGVAKREFARAEQEKEKAAGRQS